MKDTLYFLETILFCIIYLIEIVAVTVFAVVVFVLCLPVTIVYALICLILDYKDRRKVKTK